MGDDDLLREAVDATVDRLTALEEADQHMRRRNLAVWRMVREQGRSASEVERLLQSELQARGFTLEALGRAGVTYHNIRAMTRGDRPE